MKVEQNKMVALSYVLSSNGEVIETVTAQQPMEFIYGIGYLLPKFEEYIKGAAIGDKFEFTLDPIDAYGEYDAEAIVELPKEIFEVEGEFDEEIVSIGNVVPMQDSDGNRLSGVVKSIDDTTVTMDFNHPMAGSILHFTGKVENVRELTPEDLASGGGCGCGCSCEDGCDDKEDGCGCGNGCDCE